MRLIQAAAEDQVALALENHALGALREMVDQLAPAGGQVVLELPAREHVHALGGQGLDHPAHQLQDRIKFLGPVWQKALDLAGEMHQAQVESVDPGLLAGARAQGADILTELPGSMMKRVLSADLARQAEHAPLEPGEEITGRGPGLGPQGRHGLTGRERGQQPPAEQGVQVGHGLHLDTQSGAQTVEQVELVLAAHVDKALTCRAGQTAAVFLQEREYLLVRVALNEHRSHGEEKLFVVRVQPGQKTLEQTGVRVAERAAAGRGMVGTEDQAVGKVLHCAQVDEIGGVGDQEEQALCRVGQRITRQGAHLLHQESLELRMKVQLRLIYDQAVELVIVQEREQCDQLFQPVALILAQTVLPAPGDPAEPRGEPAAPLDQFQAASEKLAQGGLDTQAHIQLLLEDHQRRRGETVLGALAPPALVVLVADALQHQAVRALAAIGRVEAAQAVGGDETGAQPGRGLGQQADQLAGEHTLARAVRPDQEIDRTPVVLLENLVAPEKRYVHPDRQLHPRLPVNRRSDRR